MCIKDLQTQVTYLFFLSRKKPKLTLTDYVIKLDVKAQKVKCQISHIIVINYENEVISIAPIHWDK